ncbi:MAG: metallophosphoesterase [Polyangia bacterium]
MKLQFLAISDTHLGEDTSLLGFPHGLQRLWEALRGAFGHARGDDPGEPVYVEELILLGDIPDRTLSSTAQITTCTNAFLDTLASALDVRRVVYVPGNHDHTVWTELRAPHDLPLITPPEGVRIFSSAGPSPGQNHEQGPGPVFDLAAAELLAVFFGYPHGAAWNRVVQKWPINFHVANPVYARRFRGRTYVFTHGTHFRSDVLLPGWVKVLVDRLQIDALLGAIDLDTSGLDPNEADDLLDLERRITPFVESLWPSSKDRPTSRADELWYLLMTLSARFGKHLPPPPAPFVLYSREQLLAERPARVRDLCPAIGAPHPAIPRLRQGLWRHLLTYLTAHELPSDDLTLVFGDTHDGGSGELVTTSRRARLYNTGGWVVHNQLEHPPTQLFAVDEAGTEYILDVGFRGVRLSPDDPRTEIITLAAEDAEHRASTISRLLRAVLATFPTRP